jgi:DNA replicative helicase MCM subunit Mcm2 (Cdc46/Mcm family)
MESTGKIRDLKTGILGKLTTITGTITRSTEARPELYIG